MEVSLLELPIFNGINFDQLNLLGNLYFISVLLALSCTKSSLKYFNSLSISGYILLYTFMPPILFLNKLASGFPHKAQHYHLLILIISAFITFLWLKMFVYLHVFSRISGWDLNSLIFIILFLLI